MLHAPASAARRLDAAVTCERALRAAAFGPQGCACDSRFLNLANTFGGTPPAEVVAGAPACLCAAVVGRRGLGRGGCSMRALRAQATACSA